MADKDTDTIFEVKPSIKKTIQIIFSKFLYEAAICFVIVALVVPTLVYYFIYDMGTELPDETATCVLQYNYRVPCGFVKGLPMGNLSINRCKNIHCCFDPFTQQCFHYFPSKFGYHHLTKNSKIFESHTEFSPLGTEMHTNLSIDISINMDYLQADLVYEKLNSKKKQQRVDIDTDLVYKIPSNRLGLEVSRKSDPSKVILQTARGPLIASDGYWEWTIQLCPTNASLYGLGGLHINGNLTKVIYKNAVDHSSLPFFLANYENEFHAVHVQHEGPLEVQVLDSKLIILRSLGIKGLGLRLFPGPSIADVQRQRLGSILPSDMLDSVPRWLLGSHLCRNKIADLPTLLDEYIEEYAASNLEPDSDCFNEMLVILLIEHYKKSSPNSDESLISLRKFMNTRVQSGWKFVLALSPHIPIGEFGNKHDLYLDAEEKQVLLKNKLNRVYEAEYKGKNVAILDFTATKIKEYLKSLFEIITKELGVTIDAVYLLDNWPQDDHFNFDPVNENLVYYNDDIIKAMNQTPTSINHQELYITYQINVIKSLLGTKPIVFSASTMPDIYLPRLPQHVNLTWTNLQDTTTRHLFNNLLGHPISHSPVCGTPESIPNTAHANELCARWYLNAATQPGQRFTSDWLLHANFSTSSRIIAEKSLNVKKMLSYYQFSILSQSGAAIKPMFMDFHKDNQTWDLQEQHMIGDLITVSIQLPQSIMTKVYLPKESNWYEFWGGMHFGTGWHDISVAKDEIIMFMKESSMVPLWKEETDEMDLEHFDLIIATACNKTDARLITASFVINTVGLELTANVDEGYLEVENILQVQNDINCGSDLEETSIIYLVTIYDCLKSHSYHNLNFDICSSTEDTQKLIFKERI